VHALPYTSANPRAEPATQVPLSSDAPVELQYVGAEAFCHAHRLMSLKRVWKSHVSPVAEHAYGSAAEAARHVANTVANATQTLAPLIQCDLGRGTGSGRLETIRGFGEQNCDRMRRNRSAGFA
jgi:hypothetical protein